MEQRYIIALEIGSSKIRGALGTYVTATGEVTVNAVEEEKLVDCVRHGCIQNVAEVTNRVRVIVKRLQEREPNRRIKGVYVGLGGRSVTVSPASFERRFANDTEITRDIVRSLFDEARGTVLNDRDVIDVTAREFRVDGAHVNRPIGTIGRSLVATLNLVTARPQIKRNIYSVVHDRLQLDINGCVVRQVALAEAVLTQEDMRLGCMLVDFGAETTTVSIYRQGSLQYLATLPIGSRNITRDITALNYVEENAEQIKITRGNASPRTGSAVFDPYDNSAYGGDFVEMNNYVSARAGEIIANITAQLKHANLAPAQIPAGVVLVGNGARLKGFADCLSEAVAQKVRTGTPKDVNISDPRIQLSEAADVIAILREAARRGGIDCTEPIRIVEAPKPVEQPVEPEPVSKPEPGTQIGEPARFNQHSEPENPHTSTRRRTTTFDRIREKFLNIMKDDEDIFGPDEN